MIRLQPFWLAIALLTTLPVGWLIRPPLSPVQQGRSVACYPLVGLLIGGLLALAACVLTGAPAVLAAAVLLAVWVALTGALHLDGLADCSDAWAAGHADPARTLEVMKDPACGPVAVAVLVLVLLLKLGAMAAAGVASVGLLLAAPVLARAATALFMATTRYRRREGIADAQSTHLPAGLTAGLAAVSTLVLLLVLPFVLWVLLVVIAGLCGFVWRALWQRRIGGYTGDTAGGLIECVEVLVLVVGALAL